MIIAQLVTVCSAEDDDDGEEGVASTSTINSVVATRKSVNRPEPRLADLVVDFMSMVSGDFSSDPAAIGRTAPLTRPAHNKAICTP